MWRSVVGSVVDVREDSRGTTFQRPQSLQGGNRQVMKDAEAYNQVGKGSAKGNLGQIGHEEQSACRCTEILAGNEDCVREVKQQKLPTTILQEVAPSARTAA